VLGGGPCGYDETTQWPITASASRPPRRRCSNLQRYYIIFGTLSEVASLLLPPSNLGRSWELQERQEKAFGSPTARTISGWLCCVYIASVCNSAVVSTNHNQSTCKPSVSRSKYRLNVSRSHHGGPQNNSFSQPQRPAAQDQCGP